MFVTAPYKIAPVSVQSGLISLRACLRMLLREGQQFRDWCSEIDNTQWLSADHLASFHRIKLQGLIAHAAATVPFYRQMCDGRSFLGESAADILAVMPLLDKEQVRAAGSQLISEVAKRPLFEDSTSGTTGTPLNLLQDLSAISRENAFIRRQMHWAGFKHKERRAWIRGDMIVPVLETAPPFWRRNHAENMLMFSSYHLSEGNAQVYIDELTRFDPVLIQAYPSSIGFLAKFMGVTATQYRGRSLVGIITSSESLSDDQRRSIESTFGCRVFDWYGQFERVAAIGTCEYGQYHVMSDYSYVELLPSDNGLFEIVGTGYNNLAMPLIRYRTGDYVEHGASMQCDCGRDFPVVKRVLGRADDYIKLPDGRRIGRMDHVFKGLHGILEAQIVQNHVNELVIRVVAGEGYNSAVERKLLQNTRDRVGDKILVRVERAKFIERSRSGKARNVICNV